MFAKIAKADGYVTEEEVKTIKMFMIEHLNLNAESRKKATRLFNEAKNNDEKFLPFAREFSLAYQHDLQTRAQVFEMLLAVALADGILHPEEDRLLMTCLQHFELNSTPYENIRRDCLEILIHFMRYLAVPRHVQMMNLKRLTETFLKIIILTDWPLKTYQMA